MLPVVAAWVGTVMAFYFGKENFKAATDSLSQIARQLTSQEKLGQTNVQEIGKPMEAVATRFREFHQAGDQSRHRIRIVQ